MLNIYYGAETTDKERFIFNNIEGKTLLLVPDQFSLQAERDAFFYLEKECLMDLRVVDFNALGHKVVSEAGGGKPQLIDKYGSQMLLTKVLGQVDKELTVYRGFSWKSSFIDRIYGVISDMKRYGVEPDMLEETIDKLDENTYLKYKLTDINKIYAEYQKLIDGKYLDAEDYILFYGEKILSSTMVAESEVWIYGFDTFTPKNILVVERLIKTARKVNIVMTYEEDNEIFSLTRHVMDKLIKTAEDINEEVNISKIEGDIKKSVWGCIGGDDTCCQTGDTYSPVTMVAASNQYAEAERAAAYILSLVRDHGYKYGDIVVVCNDMEGRGNVLRRTFTRWGIPLFIDKKRTVMHHPAVSCLLAVMEIVSKGYRTESVMRMIKSGLMGFSAEAADRLENYVSSFKIRGTAWTKEFTRTGDKYSEEDLNMLNSLRETIVDTVQKAGLSIGKYNTASEKTKGLYNFLVGEFGMPERIENLIARQEAAGFAEGAAETAQSWSVICSILDQIVEILGEEKVSNEELLKLMTIGMERVEIGLVPVSSDRVIMGTLQRTRLSRVKVLLIVGANAGVLPMEAGEEGLISDREKAALEELDMELSKRDIISRREESLAIHRTLHLPEERLYISCAAAGESGESQRPSEVFERIKAFLEADDCLKVLGDLENSGDVFDMLVSREGTLGYLTDAFRKYSDGEEIDDNWLKIMSWYENNHPEELDKVKAGMLFDNRAEAIGNKFSDALYRGDRDKLSVSASRLEKYSNCPFAHFIMYGLRAETPVVYEMGAREIGDVYHHCLMTLSKKLTPDPASGMTVDAPGSPWMTITEEQCRQEVADIISGDMEGFREGLLDSGKEEKYRTERVIDICSDAAWSMIKQVRKGNVKAMFFEEPFGKGSMLPPITVDAGGSEVLIRGKIDRLDVLHEDAVRVVDYKTGSDTVDVEYIRGGYKLQLMVYLKAAVEGLSISDGEASPDGSEVHELQPAGVFYFKIDDLETDADKNAVTRQDSADKTSSSIGGPAAGSNLAQRLDESYRLVGIVLNDEKLISAMDREFAEDGAGSSSVVPVKIAGKNKELKAAAGGHLMEHEEFNELMEQVDQQVKRICTEICSGNIDIKPKRERKKDLSGHKTACRYCEYKSICMFDTSFDSCRYELI